MSRGSRIGFVGAIYIVLHGVGHHICHNRQLVRKMMVRVSGHAEAELFAMLFLVSYAFLLRLPSEALPLTAHAGGSHLCIEGERLVLNLRRRKNKPGGSRLVRTCWCSQCPECCPVHVVGPFIARVPRGARLFPGITAHSATKALRAALQALGVPKASEYCTHDLRRGHAKDLQMAGAGLTLFHDGPKGK